VEEGGSPGLILLPQDLDIGSAIEDIVLIWAASDTADWRDQVAYLPI